MFNNAGIMHPEDDNALNTEDRVWYVIKRVIVIFISNFFF